MSSQLLAVDLVSQPLRPFEHVLVAAQIDFYGPGPGIGCGRRAPCQVIARPLFRNFGKMTQQMRGQGRLFMFEAGERRIVDDQGSRWCPCDYGRDGRAASQEADLADRADRESGM